MFTGITKTIEVDLGDFDAEDVCTYVSENWGIGDVYSDSNIMDYCQNAFSLGEIYSTSEVQDYCLTLEPEDIFPESALADWANRKGWKGPN
jgi:hypothetical protein